MADPRITFSKSGHTMRIEESSCPATGFVRLRNGKVRGSVMCNITGAKFNVYQLDCSPASMVDAMSRAATMVAQVMAGIRDKMATR